VVELHNVSPEQVEDFEIFDELLECLHGLAELGVIALG
jgi:hypothetical protein